MSEIEIRHLSKTFIQKNMKVKALRDINLDIEAGDIYGIIGMSGAGKSTLIRCLNYLEQPTEGQVIVRGQDLGALTEKQLNAKRKEISMIFQHFNLLQQRNVIENVIFPLTLQGIPKKKALKKGLELLETVGLTEKQKSYPSQLSGGQHQRVAIARALASNPKILLCDEATSALDPQTTEEVLKLLKEINKEFGITIVIITHQMSVVRSICNKVAIIEGGCLVENGYLQEVFSNPKSSAGKKLVFSENMDENERLPKPSDKRAVRIVFGNIAASEPIISNLVLKFKAPINILRADTKNVNGTAQGEMIISLPEDAHLWIDMQDYLRAQGLHVQEVTDYVG